MAKKKLPKKLKKHDSLQEQFPEAYAELLTLRQQVKNTRREDYTSFEIVEVTTRNGDELFEITLETCDHDGARLEKRTIYVYGHDLREFAMEVLQEDLPDFGAAMGELIMRGLKAKQERKELDAVNLEDDDE